jgi:hypothetical protein
MEVTKWNTHHLVPIMHHPMVIYLFIYLLRKKEEVVSY